MTYIHWRYIPWFLQLLTEKDNLSSSVMKACSTVTTDKCLDISCSEISIPIWTDKHFYQNGVALSYRLLLVKIEGLW
jgi:hypothetical protein